MPPEEDASGFVLLSEVVPDVILEMRYYSTYNFVGERIDGYEQPVALLTAQAADALKAVSDEVVAMGYRLKVFDAYRPQTAVTQFVRWAQDADDTRMQAYFYPETEKSALFSQGYIAERSGHSRGSTVDLTLVKLPPKPQRPYVPGERLTPCTAPVAQRFPDNSIDMGTGYDCFDTLANTADPRVGPAVAANRQVLVDAMAGAGFRNLDLEWWHYTLVGEPYPDTYFDFPVA